jgi:hypothetical protein
MQTKTLRLSFAASSLALMLACGEKPSEPAPAEAVPAAPAAPATPTTAAPAAPAPGGFELPPIPAGAKVSFVDLKDGASIEGPAADGKVKVLVKMAAENILVKPAGQIEAGSGHHHLLIDTESSPKGVVVGQDPQHLHFGKGQTEAEVELTPGEHSLELQFADGIHRAYGPELSSKIKVTVVEAKTPSEQPAKKGAKGSTGKTKQ